MRLKTTLDQWQTLYEIDRAGSISGCGTTIEQESHHADLCAEKIGGPIRRDFSAG